MGHADAIIQHGAGDAAAKIEALSRAGVRIARSPVEIGATIAHYLLKNCAT